MNKIQEKHNAIVKKALENDKEYAELKKDTEEYIKLQTVILKLDPKKLKGLLDLEQLDKTEYAFYKKNVKDYAEFYLINQDNRRKTKEIAEKELMNLEPQENPEEL